MAVRRRTKTPQAVDSPRRFLESTTLREAASKPNCHIFTPNLLEAATVDDDGVIHDVVVMTSSSKNRRNYKKILTAAAKQFEGASVYIDHKPDNVRSVADLAGRLEGVFVEGDKVKAKRLVPVGAQKNTLIETAKSASDRVGLSIEAWGNGPIDEKGVMQVEQFEGDCAALVHRPGSTKNLHESEDLEEGVVGDKVKEDVAAQKLYRINSAASDLIWSVMYDRDKKWTTLKLKVGAIDGILDSYKEELGNLIGDQKESTTENTRGDLQRLKEIFEMDIATATLDEIKKARPELFKEAAAPAETKSTVDNTSARLTELEARAEKAEAELKAINEAEERRVKTQPILEKLFKEYKVPAEKRTAVLLKELVAAKDEADMKQIMDHYQAVGLFDVPAGPPVRVGGINRVVNPIREAATGDDADKPLYEALEEKDLKSVLCGI